MTIPKHKNSESQPAKSTVKPTVKIHWLPPRTTTKIPNTEVNHWTTNVHIPARLRHHIPVITKTPTQLRNSINTETMYA